MAVYQNRIHIGRVSEVKSFPQGDYLDIEKTDHSRSLVPFRDEFILEVNLEKQQIDVIDMEGLL
jgi:ribosomal 30S subunit maturation factor RimM